MKEREGEFPLNHVPTFKRSLLDRFNPLTDIFFFPDEQEKGEGMRRKEKKNCDNIKKRSKLGYYHITSYTLLVW